MPLRQTRSTRVSRPAVGDIELCWGEGRAVAVLDELAEVEALLAVDLPHAQEEDEQVDLLDQERHQRAQDAGLGDQLRRVDR